MGHSPPRDATTQKGRLSAALFHLIFTPALVKPPDFEIGRRRTAKDLVLDRHPCQAPLASGCVIRGGLPTRLQHSDIRQRIVRAIVPMEDEVRDLHVFYSW